jgi:hypothetical protein
MKALAKKLADRMFGYFVSRFLHPELEALKAQQARLFQEIRGLARDRTDEAEVVSQQTADSAVAQGALRLDVPTEKLSLTVGERVTVTVRVENTDAGLVGLSVEVKEPSGFGVLARPLTPMPLDLASGEERRVDWEITAQRPSEVNLGRPWILEFALRGGSVEYARATVTVEVVDPEPGRIYYVLTEDSEVFDGGELTGDYSCLPELVAMHNQNNFYDPEEYRWQMVEKPDAMNHIAEQYGAKWTHFWCTSHRFAAEWASRRSSTGQWEQVVELLEESIRRGCVHHEYAPHIHVAFEPDSGLPPQPRLLYDKATDGLIPNDFYDPVTNPLHRHCGWDGGRKDFSCVKALGTYSDGDTKTGSLFKACSFLSRLQRGHRQPHSSRAGACDFGVDPEDQRTSTLAHLRNGLIADADAGYHESIGVYPRGRQMYFCRADDIEREISDLSQARLVQFKAPDFFFDAVTPDILASWFGRQWRALLLADGSVAPGVHAIVQFTHAMVMKGASGRMEDVEGGDFDKLDRHLAGVTARYPQVQFGTMSEVALEFLDYYTPVLAAVVEPQTERVEQDGKVVRFRIRLLGATIPVSAERVHQVAVRPPAWLLPEDIAALQVLRDGLEIASCSELLSGGPLCAFEVNRRGAVYELVVHLRQPVQTAAEEGAQIESPESAGQSLADSVSPIAPPPEAIVEIPSPRVAEVHRAGRDPSVGDWATVMLPAGLLRLLMNPVAGGTEPLGRGFHPLGTLLYGLAASATAAACGDPQPLAPRDWQVEHVKARHPRPVTTESDLLSKAEIVELRPGRVEASVQAFDQTTGVVLLSGTVRLRRSSDDDRQHSSR